MIASAIYTLQEKILFQPTVLAQDYVFQFSQPFEEVFLKTTDDAVIHALHLKAENPKGVILYFHGNAGDLSRWGFVAEFFVNQQYDVLIMDYRTYGKSSGKLSEQALYDDAQVCYDYLLKHYDETEIIVYGRSLGTAIATNVASKNKPKQLILETPYYSMVDLAQKKFPIIPVKYLVRYQMPTFEFAKKVACHIIIFHGTEDGIVPFKSGKKLFESLPKEQVTFIQIESAGHNNLIEFEAYRKGIEDVLK